jgi:hypothetical protein
MITIPMPISVRHAVSLCKVQVVCSALRIALISARMRGPRG